MSTASSDPFSIVLSNMLADQAKGNRQQDQSRIALVKAATAAAKPEPKAAKGRKVKASAEETPASNGEKTVVAAPVAIDLEAKEFLAMLRNAGRREVDGKRIYDQAEVRNDTIALIARYMGYDPNGSFASQELAARTKAIRETRKEKEGDVDYSTVPLRSEVRRVNATLTGYVAGIPDPVQRRIDDLKGRERLTVEELIAFEKAAAPSVTADDQQRGIVIAKTAVERERLTHILDDIAFVANKR